MRNKRQKSNWDRWENVKAAHAKILQEKLQEREKGKSEGNRMEINSLKSC